MHRGSECLVCTKACLETDNSTLYCNQCCGAIHAGCRQPHQFVCPPESAGADPSTGGAACFNISLSECLAQSVSLYNFDCRTLQLVSLCSEIMPVNVHTVASKMHHPLHPFGLTSCPQVQDKRTHIGLCCALHAGRVHCSEACLNIRKTMDGSIAQTSANGGIQALNDGFPSCVMFTVTQGSNGKPSWLDKKIHTAGMNLLSMFKHVSRTIVDKEDPDGPGIPVHLVQAFIAGKHPLWYYNQVYLIMTWTGPTQNGKLDWKVTN